MFHPSQNDLFSLYMLRCGELRVGKPSPEVLALLAEDDRSFRARITSEALLRGVDPRDLAALDGDTPALRAARASAVPLALRRTFRLDSAARAGDRVHIGARGGVALLSLVPELPWLERLDLSTLAPLFRADAYESGRGGGVTGNDFFAELRRVVAAHPSLRAVDVRGQPIGCFAAHELLALLRDNARVREMRFDRGGVDARLAAAIDAQCARNAAAPQRAPEMPRAPSAVLLRAAAQFVDRKSARERQLLRRLIEDEPGLRGALCGDETAAFLRHARVVSTTEAATRSRGLRGDGESLFVVKSGTLRAHVDPRGFELRRGDFYGDDGGSDAPFRAGIVTEAVRGEVYCIPLAHAGALRAAWAERVDAFDETLKRAPVLQSVDKWSRLRTCSCATRVACARGETVLAPGDAFRGLFFVAAGSFTVARSGSRAGKEKRFGPGDVFGEEALVARKQCSSVAIVADADDCECIVAEGCAARVLQSYLHPVLVALASEYSQHEDLKPVSPL